MLPPSKGERDNESNPVNADGRYRHHASFISDEKAPLIPKDLIPTEAGRKGGAHATSPSKNQSKAKPKITKENVHAMAYDMHALMHQVLDIGAHEPKTMKDGLISNYNNLAIVAAVLATISLSFLTECHPPEVAP